MQSGTYRADIDGLRTLAVVPVVLFHAGFGAISGGYVGVDVFFVISGYLITGILANDIARGRFSILRFYERRARRILPALFTVLTVTFALAWLLLLPDAFEGLAKSAAATLAFLSNFWFANATSDYFGPGAEMMPLLHTWSLAVEEQFYIVFPILLWLVLPKGRGLMIWLLAVIGAASLAWACYLLPKAPADAFYLPFGRVWELGIGSLLALGVMPDLGRRAMRETVALAGLLAILAAIFLYDAYTPFPGLAALLPCLGAAALIAAGGQGPSLATRCLAWPPFVWIGLISYSLYLWHWPIFVFAKHYYGEAVLSVPIALCGTALAFLLASLSWALIERPFRIQPPAGFKRNTIFVLSAIGIVTGGAVATAIYLGNGVPGRFSPEVRATIAAGHDRNPMRWACFGRDPTRGFCRFGPEGTEDEPASVLLWGDSHADAVMPGLITAVEEAGKSGVFAGMNGCAPLLGVNRTDLGRTTACSDFNDAVLAELKARDDIPLVVLMARWALTAEGERPPGEHGRPALIAPIGSPAPDGPGENFKTFEHALEDTVAALRATGREVVLLGGVPEIGWNVPDRTAVLQRWGHALPPRPDVASATAREARVASLFERLAAEDPGVRSIPLIPVLCTPSCLTDVDGHLIYFDSNHLNAFGAETLLTPVFRRIF